MTLAAFQWVTFSVCLFFAIMILVRFAFYKQRNDSRVSVYFWGGCLFLALAVTDLVSNLFYFTDLHVWQTVVCIALTVWAMYTAAKNRRYVEVNVQ